MHAASMVRRRRALQHRRYRRSVRGPPDRNKQTIETKEYNACHRAEPWKPR